MGYIDSLQIEAAFINILIWTMGQKTVSNGKEASYNNKPSENYFLLSPSDSHSIVSDFTPVNTLRRDTCSGQNTERKTCGCCTEWSRYWSSEVALQQNKVNIGHSSAALNAEPHSHISRYYGIEGRMTDLGSDSETPDWNCQCSPVRSAFCHFLLVSSWCRPLLFIFFIAFSFPALYLSFLCFLKPFCLCSRGATHTGNTVRPTSIWTMKQCQCRLSALVQAVFWRPFI